MSDILEKTPQTVLEVNDRPPSLPRHRMSSCRAEVAGPCFAFVKTLYLGRQEKR